MVKNITYFRFFGRDAHDTLPVDSMAPIFAGCLMLAASVLPWLGNPLGAFSNAWELPLDLGWGFHIGIINYGLLCLCGALSSFLVAYAHWKPGWRGTSIVPGRRLTVWLCLAPPIVLLVQYLIADLGMVDQFAQQTMQMLLVQGHYGYNVSSQLFPVTAFTLDISTFQGRFFLLGSQLSGGFLLPIVSAWMLLEYKHLKRPPSVKKPMNYRKRMVMIGMVMIVLALWPGRALAGELCDKYARGLIAQGNYAQALGWLDTAVALNPALNQVAFYHIDRGHALYFLHPNLLSDDSSIYLAFAYRQQGDNLNAYKQLLTIWYTDRTFPVFARNEMSLTLEQIVETVNVAKFHDNALDAKPGDLRGDEVAGAWLQILVRVDPRNVYGQYMIGRVDYDTHNYIGCQQQMALALSLSKEADLQSSAYTYMALSDAGLGAYASERTFLLMAVQLDPSYHNNTAREELSGLR